MVLTGLSVRIYVSTVGKAICKTDGKTRNAEDELEKIQKDRE